jgi:hypothetical protein
MTTFRQDRPGWTGPTSEELAREGLALLVEARRYFAAAASTRTVARVKLAISSARGAVRAGQYRDMREERRQR